LGFGFALRCPALRFSVCIFPATQSPLHNLLAVFLLVLRQPLLSARRPSFLLLIAARRRSSLRACLSLPFRGPRFSAHSPLFSVACESRTSSTKTPSPHSHQRPHKPHIAALRLPACGHFAAFTNQPPVLMLVVSRTAAALTADSNLWSSRPPPNCSLTSASGRRCRFCIRRLCISLTFVLHSSTAIAPSPSPDDEHLPNLISARCHARLPLKASRSLYNAIAQIQNLWKAQIWRQQHRRRKSSCYNRSHGLPCYSSR